MSGTRSLSIVLLTIGMLIGAARANAQEILTTGPLAGAPAVRSSYEPSPGSKTAEQFVLPSGQVETGGEIVFLTSDAAKHQAELKFTDVGLLRLRGRRALGKWLEATIGAELLVKQPESWDEPLLQTLLGGVRVPFGHRFAMSLGGAGGALLGARGRWWELGPSLIAKPVVNRDVRFELSLGQSTTVLDFERDERRFWLEEIVGHAEAQLGEREAALWLGVDYSRPVASGPHEPATPGGRFLAPNVRLSLQLGGVMTPRGSNWDLFVVYSVVDRGDLDHPETTLPILDGGFDQQQLAIGVQHRFGVKESEE